MAGTGAETATQADTQSRPQAGIRKIRRPLRVLRRPIDYKDMQVDHIKAKYAGGADELDNYNPACRMCNFYKGTMDIDHFRDQLKLVRERLHKVYIYRLSLAYGLIQEKDNNIEFYFEKCNKGE